MPSAHAPLGDSHNFGRRVSSRGRFVHKPRTVAWERLLLSADSPLRALLDECAERDGLGRQAFGFLPTLRFLPGDARRGGAVERVRLSPLPALSPPRRRELASIVGRSLALWSFLGVADLHFENLALGLDRRGRIVFGPLDVEMILADLSLPTETKLLPDADPEYAAECRHACGVRRVLPYLGKPIGAPDLLAMASAYRTTLAFLERHARALAQAIAAMPGLSTAPIRVCLRGTSEYVRARTEPVWPPLLAAESEQLVRGDIPYFFRLYGQPGIRYYENRTLTRSGRIGTRGDVPRLAPLLSLSRGLRAPSRRTLRDDGLLALIAAFDHPALTGRHLSAELELHLRARSIVVGLPDGRRLRAARDQSARVGSVYLPCRCGEVRTVLVPAVTACVPAQGRRKTRAVRASR